MKVMPAMHVRSIMSHGIATRLPDLLLWAAVYRFPSLFVRAAASKQFTISEGLYNPCARCNNCVWAPPKRSAPQPEKRSKKNGNALYKWPRSGQVKRFAAVQSSDFTQLK